MGLVTGWVALVPLMAAVASSRSTRATFLGWLFGFVVNLGVFAWLFVVPGFRWYHFFLLNAYLALYPTLWCLIFGRFPRASTVAQIGMACAWVLLDYVRSHLGFLALPWMTLAQSQVDNTPLLQTACIFGEPAVTFLVVLGNLAIWNLASGSRKRIAMLCIFPVLCAMALGLYVLNNTDLEVHTRTRVAALGTDFPAGNDPPPDLEARLDALLEQLDQRMTQGLGIIALPESALVNPKLFPTQISQLQRLATEHQITVIAGVAEATKFDHSPVNSLTSQAELRSGAWLFTPGLDKPQHYEKSRLIPFAEEIPMREWITWPPWLVPPIPEVVRGSAPRSYPIPGGTRVGIMICWESLFASHAETLVNDGATVLVMLANESWFGNTAAGSQHNLTARMRAAETRRTVLVSSNMGPPLVIDPFGQVIAGHSSVSGMHWATATVPMVTERTFYTRLGDVFVLGCTLFFLTVLILAKRKGESTYI